MLSLDPGVFEKRWSKWTQLIRGFVFLVSLAPLLAYSAEHGDEAESTSAKAEQTSIEQRWGIKPKAMRLSGEDHFLDFRYEVLDSDKAASILKRGEKAFLIDQETGKALPVPVTKLGPLRSTGVKPKVGKQYVILFSNNGNIIKKGSKVTVAIGEARIENLVVE